MVAPDTIHPDAVAVDYCVAGIISTKTTTGAQTVALISGASSPLRSNAPIGRGWSHGARGPLQPSSTRVLR